MNGPGAPIFFMALMLFGSGMLLQNVGAGWVTVVPGVTLIAVSIPMLLYGIMNFTGNRS